MSERPIPNSFNAICFGDKDLHDPAPVSWICQGILAAGHMTLLISQWKSGKSTLLSLLLGCRRAGGQLAGFAVKEGKTMVISEESIDLWGRRHRKLNFGDNAVIYSRPFAGMNRDEAWPKIVEMIETEQQSHGFDLVVIDSLAVFLPGNAENNASLLLETLAALERFTSRGIAILLIHHPSKGKTIVGQAARGTGALAGLVDIILEMDFFRRRDLTDRRRTFHLLSRLDDSPGQFVLELNKEGTAYKNLGSGLTLEFEEIWDVLSAILGNTAGPLTRRQILDFWPNPELSPNPAALCRFLNRAVEQKLLIQTGRGTKNDSFRFSLAGKENAA
jgi:hypothetical protein